MFVHLTLSARRTPRRRRNAQRTPAGASAKLSKMRVGGHVYEIERQIKHKVLSKQSRRKMVDDFYAHSIAESVSKGQGILS